MIKKQDADLPDYALGERQTLMRGIGLSEEAVKGLQIGVVSSWGEINPASIHLNRVAEAIKAGIWSAGGTPREFEIDIPNEKLNIQISDEEIKERLKKWKIPKPKVKKGYLSIYARMANTTEKGAALRYGPMDYLSLEERNEGDFCNRVPKRITAKRYRTESQIKGEERR